MSVIEYAISLALVNYVPIIRRPVSLYIDESVFGVGDFWECLFEQFLARVAILFFLPVKHLSRRYGLRFNLIASLYNCGLNLAIAPLMQEVY